MSASLAHAAHASTPAGSGALMAVVLLQ
jgi:hypothetical protein